MSDICKCGHALSYHENNHGGCYAATGCTCKNFREELDTFRYTSWAELKAETERLLTNIPMEKILIRG
jgi:hypothetical protein